MFRKLSLAAIALSVSFVLAMSPITLPKAYADSGVSGVSASQNEFVERLLIELTNIEISVDDTPDMIRIKYETATIEFVYVNCFSDKGTVDLETFKGFLEEAPKFDPKKKGMDEFIEFAGSLDYGRILDLLGTSVTLLQNVEDLVNLVTHIEGFSDGRMSIIEKTTVLDGLRSIYAIAGDVAGYVPLVGPLLSIPFDVGEKAVGFVQEVTDKIFARYFDYLKLEVLIRINAVGSDGNPIGTFGKGDRLAINEAAIRAGLGASSDVAQKLAEVKDTLGLTIRLRDVMGYYRSIHRSSYGTTAALDESIESVDGQIAHLNECIQVLSICQILQETEEECKDTDKVVVIYFEDGEYKYIVEDSIKTAQETLIKLGVDRVFGEASGTTSPLVIDLDGDGFDTTSLDEGAYFDLAASGFKIKTGWFGANEGILTRDLNGDGVINNGKELFGNNTMLKNGELAKNGFEALKDLDENNDGVFDAQDPLFNEVLLWIDEGSDGISHPEELFTLSEKSILSIDLVYENVNILDPRGHSILQASTATSSEGQILDIVDIWLLRDVQDSVSTEILPVPEDIAKLPDINGLGMVHSLHQSMVRDKTGSLKDMVTQFVSEPKRDVRLDLADKIIQAWTGETDKLKVLEAFYGRTYTGGKGPNAMKVIYSGYDSLVMLLYQCLMADSHFDSYYQSMRFDSSGKINLDNTAKLLLDNIAADKTKGEDTLIEFLSNMSTMTSLKRMDHEKFVETLGNANPKYGILANAGYGYVSFSKENESTIQGASSIENLFVVGSGNHNISGGNKDDTYLFSDPLGDNTITDPKGNAAIVLGEEISPDDIRVCSVFHEDSSGMLDIRITVAETKGSITIKGFSYSSTCSIVFADGVVANVLDFVAWTEISSPSELLELASNPRGYFRLTTDIDLEGIEWTPIGSSSAPFIGFFDGNGHVIENLIVDLPERDCVGLFGASKGVISGISVQNASVAGKDYVGTIVGRSEGSFADSAAEGINVSGRNYAGGLAGRAASVSGCSADGGAIRGGIFVGGLVGECSSVCDSRATAGVTGSNWVGGLAGHLASGGGAARCSAWGNVGLASDAASNSRAGGLIGRLESPAEDCFSTGNVATSSHAGGLVGYATSSITRCYTLSSSSNGLVGAGGALADSYFDRDLAPSAPASEPGGRSTADMQQASTYEGWDFESVWQIEPGSYPSLRGQGPSDSKPEVPEEKPSEPEVPELNEGDIASVEGLKAMQNNLMGDYRLVADIDLSGVDWTPIGDGVAPFFGSFDGNGYVIKNLSVDMPERDFVGLFGVSSGSLSNVSIDGVVLAGKNYTGAVVGKAEGIVQNPVITGEIGITGGSYVGGIVGYVKGNLADIKVEGIKSLKGIDYVGGVAGYVKGNVSDSGVSGIEEIVASSSCAGGLVGEVSGSLSNCFATENGVFRAVNNVAGLAGKAGSVSDSHVSDMEAIILDAQTGSMNAAGLVGQVQGETKNCTVSGIGSISGEGNRIAGLVGYGIGGIDGCEVSGISSLQGSTKVAGLVGDTYRAVVDCKVSSIGSISGMRDVAGLAGYAKLVSGCTVETIDSITSTKERAAGLTGSAETIESSSVRDVGMVTGGGYVGGLAGKAKNVSRSYADVPVAAKSAVGGLLGLAEEGGTVEACFAAGAVSSTSASGTSLGGLVGSLKGALRDSFSLGSVLAGAQTGGLVGVVGETGSIERCFTLSGNDSGLVGSGLYADSYFAWERSGGDASLPGARALSDLAFSSTYEGWDFGSVWQIEPGSLPSLRGVAASTVYVRELAAKLGVSEGSSEMGAVQPSSDEGAEEDQAGSPNSSDVPVGSSEPTVSTDEGDSTAPDGKEGPLEDLDEGSAEGQSSPDDAAPDALRFEGDLAA